MKGQPALPQNIEANRFLNPCRLGKEPDRKIAWRVNVLWATAGPDDITHWALHSSRPFQTSSFYGGKKGSGPHSTLQGREQSVFNETNIGTVRGQPWGDCWETGWSAYGPFRALRCHLELKLKLVSRVYRIVFSMAVLGHGSADGQNLRTLRPTSH